MKSSVLKEIQGTWHLKSINLVHSNGIQTEMFGENPNGIAMFDSDGYMNTQMGAHNRPLFSSESINQGTPEEISMAFNSYMAFYGKYSEVSPGTLSVRIVACLFPNWVEKEIIRYAEIADNTLILLTPPTKIGLDEIIVKAIWQRR